MKELSTIGKSLPLVDGPEKVTGAAKFTADIHLPDMLYAKCLRSPYAHARIIDIDTSKAAKLSGVKAILTYKDVPQVKMHPVWTWDQFIMEQKVRFIGDEVAAVAAVTEDTAEEALDLINVKYDVLSAVFDSEEAMKPAAPRVQPDGNIQNPLPLSAGVTESMQTLDKPLVVEWGNVERGFDEADRIFEDTFTTGIIHPAPLEPRACLATWENERLILWISSQTPYAIQQDISRVLGLPMNRVRVISTYVGGGFGGKYYESYACIAALLARMSRQPVKLEYSREEEFIAGRRKSSMKMHIKIGVKKDGTLTAIDARHIFELGAYGSYLGGSAFLSPTSPTHLYRCPNARWEAYDVFTNLPAARTIRGVSNPQQLFGLEQVIDKIATDLGIDPIDFRLKNHIRLRDPMRHQIPPAFLALDSGPTSLSSIGLDDCLRKGAKRIGWNEKRRHKVKAEGTKRRGLGAAMVMHTSGFPGCSGSAFIMMNEDGTFHLFIGSVEMGQGIRTTLTQVAAEVLGVPLEDVYVTIADTDLAPFAPESIASSSAHVMSLAVKAAAEDVKKHLFTRAAAILGAKVRDLEACNKTIYMKSTPEKRIPITELAKEATLPEYITNRKGLQRGTIMGKGAIDQPYVPYHARCFAAHFAEVEVDIETGQVKVLRLVAAQDVGRAINPRILEGQIYGGVVMGIGYALTEQLQVNEGKVLNPTFLDYRLIRAPDIPEIEPVIVESIDRVGAFGIKGAGESSLSPAPAAIANAIYNAIGVQIKDLPITPEKVLEALNDKEKTRE